MDFFYNLRARALFTRSFVSSQGPGFNMMMMMTSVFKYQ